MLIACAAVVLCWAVAVFAWDEAEALVSRVWQRLARAWMQCDEARG